MPAATGIRPEARAPDESRRPALLRHRQEAVSPLPSSPRPPGKGDRPELTRIAAVVLLVPCAYLGVRLADGNGSSALPAALPAHEASVVVGGPDGASGRDARELRALRADPAVAAAQSRAAAERPNRGQRRPPGSEGESPPSSRGGGGDGDGGGTDETDPNLTLPVIGETPIPDPGLEVPQLPVDPGTLPDPGDVLPDAGVTVPEPEVPLP
jgi:hypothetical protein